MRYLFIVAILLLAALAPRLGWGYELTGRIDPPSPVWITLRGATTPFEVSTSSNGAGRFRFTKVPAGTYTLAVVTAARGEVAQTVELSPGTVDARGRLELALRLDAGRLESENGRATAATVSAVALSIPDRATEEYGESQKCLARGDTSGTNCAITHLQRSVEIAPRFADAWNQMGTIAYREGKYSDAETDFRKSIEAEPGAFAPLVNLGGVLLNLGRPREALGYNQRAVARRPNDALANSQLGLSYFMLNDPDRAERYLTEAVKLDPAHFSHPQLTLARIYVGRGDRPAAVAELRDFLTRHPDSPEAAGVRQEIGELSH